MVTAKFEYRSFVPAWTLAIEFASVEFGGNQKLVKKVDSMFHYTKFKQSYIDEEKIDCLNILINKNQNKINELQNKITEIQNSYNQKIQQTQTEIDNVKNSYKIYFLHKDVRVKIKELNNKIEQLKNECEQQCQVYKDKIQPFETQNKSYKNSISSIKNKEEKDVYDEIREIRDFLADLQFTCKSTYHKDNNGIDVEIYEFIDDKELEKIVENYKTQLYKEIASEIVSIRKRYGIKEEDYTHNQEHRDWKFMNKKSRLQRELDEIIDNLKSDIKEINEGDTGDKLENIENEQIDEYVIKENTESLDDYKTRLINESRKRLEVISQEMDENFKRIEEEVKKEIKKRNITKNHEDEHQL